MFCDVCRKPQLGCPYSVHANRQCYSCRKVFCEDHMIPRYHNCECNISPWQPCKISRPGMGHYWPDWERYNKKEHGDKPPRLDGERLNQFFAKKGLGIYIEAVRDDRTGEVRDVTLVRYIGEEPPRQPPPRPPPPRSPCSEPEPAQSPTPVVSSAPEEQTPQQVAAIPTVQEQVPTQGPLEPALSAPTVEGQRTMPPSTVPSSTPPVQAVASTQSWNDWQHEVRAPAQESQPEPVEPQRVRSSDPWAAGGDPWAAGTEKQRHK